MNSKTYLRTCVPARGEYWQVGLTSNYAVLLGRRDSLTASKAQANISLPAPNLNFSGLVQNFAAVGLDETDLVALSGMLRILLRLARSHSSLAFKNS